MSKSRARLASDWFAKLRQNAVTNEVEHTDVVDVAVAEASSVQSNDSPTFGTVTATSFVGDGSNLTGVGGSTTAGDVGTYAFAVHLTDVNANWPLGTTIAGSLLYSAGASMAFEGNMVANEYYAMTRGFVGPSALSGTWRSMGYNRSWQGFGTNDHAMGLWLRIS